MFGNLWSSEEILRLMRKANKQEKWIPGNEVSHTLKNAWCEAPIEKNSDTLLPSIDQDSRAFPVNGLLPFLFNGSQYRIFVPHITPKVMGAAQIILAKVKTEPVKLLSMRRLSHKWHSKPIGAANLFAQQSIQLKTCTHLIKYSAIIIKHSNCCGTNHVNNGQNKTGGAPRHEAILAQMETHSKPMEAKIQQKRLVHRMLGDHCRALQALWHTLF